MKPLFLIPVLMASTLASASEQPLGIFARHGDVGDPQIAGSASHEAASDTYTISGAGSNMWAARDEFHFVYNRMKGDFIVTARVAFKSQGVDPHRKIGWIARDSLDPDSKHANACLHGDGLISLQYRRTTGGETEEVRPPNAAPDVIQLERRGQTFIMSTAKFGETFTSVEVADPGLGDEVFVGLYVCSHNPDVSETATFHNVRIVRPAPAGLVPYRDYIGSRLELLDVETGRREIVHTTTDSMQAPNWTPDGRHLIYNRNGLLYRFDLQTREVRQIDTGFAVRNNNDHVLSFDGKQIAISHHADDADGASVIYTLPIDGGVPTRVTPNAPSYLHGWSPDGRFLVYTGGRGGAYNIYKIPVSGGEEIQLTHTPTLDDGPEYSPDGDHIYFNSVRSGLMQLWRMKPDGSGQEQLTDDGFNNWFPHLSPDGTRVVFLSYGQDVDPSDHPFYKHVTIRMMPADGSAEPRVLAYLYGGQGTINVPSWSPDGRRIAFVSNTILE